MKFYNKYIDSSCFYKNSYYKIADVSLFWKGLLCRKPVKAKQIIKGEKPPGCGVVL